MSTYIKNTCRSLFNWLYLHYGWILGIAAIFVGIAIAVWQFEVYRGPKNVFGEFKLFDKKPDGKLIIGKIKNKDKINADKLKVRSKYCGNIIKLTCDPSFDKTDKESTKPEIYIELDKLSINQQCNIDILGDNKFEIPDNIINVAWGNGRFEPVKVITPTPDEVRLMESLDRANKALFDASVDYLKKNQPTVK